MGLLAFGVEVLAEDVEVRAESALGVSGHTHELFVEEKGAVS